MGRLMKLNKSEGAFEKGKKQDLRLVKSAGRMVRRAKKLDAAHFIKDFEEIVSKEMQKASRCIDRINEDIVRYSRDLRFQLYTLKELWRLVPPSKNREERAIKIMNKIAFCKQTIQEYEQCTGLIKRRALLLQEELGILLLAHSH